MKKLKLKLSELKNLEVLSKEKMKNITGGCSGGTGCHGAYTGRSGYCLNCDCVSGYGYEPSGDCRHNY